MTPRKNGNGHRSTAPRALSEADAESLTNTQLVVLAAYMLGGERQPIDTEDLAVKAHDLVPTRFAWHKYPDQINLELVRVYASEAKKEPQGRLLRGSGNHGWMLTQAGLAWATAHVDRFVGLSADRERDRRTDRALKAERNRLLSSEAFCKLRADSAADVTLREAETFFRLDPYVTGNKREERILRILNAFGDDAVLGPVVKELARVLREHQGVSQA